MSGPVLALVGGFLGAGKTTLLLAAGERLRGRGARVAIITNDQGEDVVDTRLASAAGFPSLETAGGCFCCRFSDLIDAADALTAHRPEVIFAEPVGSCMDLSATVLQPLKALGRFRVAPYTVLVDARRLQQDLGGDTDYLLRNQIAEADILCASKCDAGSPPPGGVVFDHLLSAFTGQGIEGWLTDVLAGSRLAGARLLQVDYERYARAEASLGWLNWRAKIRPEWPRSPAEVIGPFLDALDAALTDAGATIAHMKAFDEAATGYVKASICRNGEEPVVQGTLVAEPAGSHEVLLNIRALASPETLRAVVDRVVAAMPWRASVLQYESFRPSAPQPERRLDRVIHR